MNALVVLTFFFASKTISGAGVKECYDCLDGGVNDRCDEVQISNCQEEGIVDGDYVCFAGFITKGWITRLPHIQNVMFSTTPSEGLFYLIYPIWLPYYYHYCYLKNNITARSKGCALRNLGALYTCLLLEEVEDASCYFCDNDLCNGDDITTEQSELREFVSLKNLFH